MFTAIVGSRTYPLTKTQFDLMKEQNLDNWAAVLKEARERVFGYVDMIAASGHGVVSGGAAGPDTWGVERADELGINTLVIKAEWKKYGKGAGFKRNKDIVHAANDVIAFWDLVSKGTEDTIAYAIKLHKPILVLGPVGQVLFAASEEDWGDFELLAKPTPKMEVPSEPQ